MYKTPIILLLYGAVSFYTRQTSSVVVAAETCRISSTISLPTAQPGITIVTACADPIEGTEDINSPRSRVLDESFNSGEWLNSTPCALSCETEHANDVTSSAGTNDAGQHRSAPCCELPSQDEGNGMGSPTPTPHGQPGNPYAGHGSTENDAEPSSSTFSSSSATSSRHGEIISEAFRRVRVTMDRLLHVRREMKAVFSSELERCLLKATRPESSVVDESYMQALLAQTNRLEAVQACCDCDPHEVVCSKLFKKMMERDWRTVAKALYVVHRLQRDSQPKHAARFSAFMKEKWAEGAGELGKHIRTEGGRHAPWLKVYCGYLATRGRRLEIAGSAFQSWETLTSIRQLRNALTETNALLAGALSLHFAADASSSAGKGVPDLHRSCCALTFKDVADVQAMVRDTDHPPALLGVPGVGTEHTEGLGLESSVADVLSDTSSDSSLESTSTTSKETDGAFSTSLPQSQPRGSLPPEPATGDLARRAKAQKEGAERNIPDIGPMKITGISCGEPRANDAMVAVKPEVTPEERTNEEGAMEQVEVPCDDDGQGSRAAVGIHSASGCSSLGREDRDDVQEPMKQETRGHDENAATVAHVAGVVARADISEEVQEVARESATYKDVGGVINTVYAARYGEEQGERTSILPLWVREMAELSCIIAASSSSEKVIGGRDGKGAFDASHGTEVRGGWTCVLSRRKLTRGFCSRVGTFGGNSGRNKVNAFLGGTSRWWLGAGALGILCADDVAARRSDNHVGSWWEPRA